MSSGVSRLPAPLVEIWQWQQHGACRGHDTALFFPPDGERGQQRSIREATAKALCARCPVRLACRAHALAVHEPYGVWGGLSESERSLLVTDDDDPGAALLNAVMVGPAAADTTAPPPDTAA